MSAAPVAAQDDDDAELTLLGQTPLVPANGTFTARIDPGSLDLQGLEVVATVYRIVDTTSELGAERTQADTLNRLVLGPAGQHLAPGTGELEIDIDVRGGEPFDDVNRVRLPDAGVYPVRIELRDSEAVTMASVTTTLIRLPAPGAEGGPPLPVAVLLHTPGAGMSLTATADVLAAHPSVPITLALGTGELADLADRPSSTQQLAEAMAGRPVLFGTEPSLDPSALAAIDEAPLYADQLDAAVGTVERLGLASAPSVLAIDTPLTVAGASELRTLGITTAVERSRTEPVAGTMDTDAGPLHVVSPGTESAPTDETWLHKRLAQFVLSRHAGSAGELLDVPSGTDPAILLLLLDVLSAHRDLLAPVPLAELAPVLAGDPMEPASQPRQDLGPLAESLAATLADLAVYESFYVDGPGSPASYRAMLTEAIDVHGNGDTSADALATLDGIRRQLADELTVVSLPGDQSVTLAARSAMIPLTVSNASGGQRQVRLQFRSDKLIVAEDGKEFTIGPGTSSIDVRVDARSLGMSPLVVTILTADGQHQLATSRFEIRSTAVPGLGVLISVIGLALLGVWWYASIRRKRGSAVASGSV